MAKEKLAVLEKVIAGLNKPLIGWQKVKYKKKSTETTQIAIAGWEIAALIGAVGLYQFFSGRESILKKYPVVGEIFPDFAKKLLKLPP